MLPLGGGPLPEGNSEKRVHLAASATLEDASSSPRACSATVTRVSFILITKLPRGRTSVIRKKFPSSCTSSERNENKRKTEKVTRRTLFSFVSFSYHADGTEAMKAEDRCCCCLLRNCCCIIATIEPVVQTNL